MPVSWLVNGLGKTVLREQETEFLDIRVGLYIKVETEIPSDDNFFPLCKCFI